MQKVQTNLNRRGYPEIDDKKVVVETQHLTNIAKKL